MLNDVFAQSVQLGLIRDFFFPMVMPTSFTSSCRRAARSCIRLGSILVALALPLSAAEDLLELRRYFLKALLSDSQVLTDQYERALAKLEAEAAAAGDYEEAQLILKRREELKMVYRQSDAASTPRIPLSADKARLSGAAEARGETLTGWRSASSLAEWSNVKVPPGIYYLELEANLTELTALAGAATTSRSQPQEKVTFAFYEVSLLPGAQENRRSFDISLNADSSTYSPIHIGPISFTRSPVTVRLAPEIGYPGNSVRLRKVQLTQELNSTIQAASLPNEKDSLQQSNQRLISELSRSQKPVLSAYEAKLRELAVMPALREEALIEAQKLAQLQAKDLDKAGHNPLTKMLTRQGGVTGFEDIDGAKIVSGSMRDGDHFTIEHNGQQRQISLLWLQCAALDEKDESRKIFAKHFEIDGDDISALARAAREFTLGYLDGKSLRLLLRPGKEKDGSQPALVFLPEVGLYQNILVDQGLAAVRPPPVKDGRRGMMEKGLLGTLLDREAVAKKQNNGAWALNANKK